MPVRTVDRWRDWWREHRLLTRCFGGSRFPAGSRRPRLMTGAPVTVLPEEDVVQAIDLLLESKVGALPVVTEETGSLIGILSYVDVLRGLRDGVS